MFIGYIDLLNLIYENCLLNLKMTSLLNYTKAPDRSRIVIMVSKHISETNSSTNTSPWITLPIWKCRRRRRNLRNALESYLEVLLPIWQLGSSVCRRAGWGWWAGGRLCRAVCCHIQRTQLQALWAPGRYTRLVTETVLPWGREGRERWMSSTLSQRSETEALPLSSAGKNPR